MYRFGVDEAGKGPVLGSMFVAAVSVDDPSVLPGGIDDSKRLSPKRREDLVATLRDDDRIHSGIAEITTDRIDDPTTDMNGLAVTGHAKAIDAVAEQLVDGPNGVGATRSIDGLCDACDTDANRFAERVAETCQYDVAVDARHGADENSPLVAAASVIAKVERDAHVERIAEEYGDVGSGYPSDPTTRDFLEAYVAKNGVLPPVARTSWSTCTDVLARASQTGLDEFGGR